MSASAGQHDQLYAAKTVAGNRCLTVALLAKCMMERAVIMGQNQSKVVSNMAAYYAH